MRAQHGWYSRNETNDSAVNTHKERYVDKRYVCHTAASRRRLSFPPPHLLFSLKFYFEGKVARAEDEYKEMGKEWDGDT